MDDHFESVNLMVDDRPVTSAENWRLRRVAGLFAATSFALAIVGTGASAQVAKWAAPAMPEAPPAPTASPATPDAAKDGGKDATKSSQWVKLCDKITISADAAGSNTDAAKDAKEGAEAPAGEEKQLCSTTFEAIESNTGQLLASVRLEEVEGAPKRALAVTVPLGVVIPAGVMLAVYNADQWARAVKNETVELKELKTVGLRFSHCQPLGCTAEAEATEEVSDLLKGNAGIGVLAIWTNEDQLAVPVPLGGFAEALAGKPVDNKEYQENRRKLVDQIHQRQIEIANKAKAEEMKTLPPPDNMTKTAPGSAAKK